MSTLDDRPADSLLAAAGSDGYRRRGTELLVWRGRQETLLQSPGTVLVIELHSHRVVGDVYELIADLQGSGNVIRRVADDRRLVLASGQKDPPRCGAAADALGAAVKPDGIKGSN